jgi:hypothetical protein
MYTNSSDATEQEVIIPPEQWNRLSETERSELKERLQAIFGQSVVVRPGTPPPGAIKFGADGSIERVPDIPPDTGRTTMRSPSKSNKHSRKPFWKRLFGLR